jgi:amino acid transporter
MTTHSPEATGPERRGSSPPDAATGFQQRLGLFDATMLVAGSMIGSGIFIVSADICRDVGSAGWLLLIWGLTGLMTIAGALSFAELAAMMPHAGGQYVFLREAHGPLWAFLYGWTCFLVIQTGFIAAVSVGFAKFLGVFIPALGTDSILWRWEEFHVDLKVPVPWLDEPLSFFKREAFTVSAGQIVAAAIVMFLSLVNCLGVQTGKWVQNVFTVAKTLGLALLIVLGLTVAANPDAIAQNESGIWHGITATPRYQEVSRIVPVSWLAPVLLLSGAMVGALFAADAWNQVTFTAAEVRNPRRNLPWSLFLGTGMVILLYILANVAYLAALPLRGDALAAARQTAMVREKEVDVTACELELKRLHAEEAALQAYIVDAQTAIGRLQDTGKDVAAGPARAAIAVRQRRLHDLVRRQEEQRAKCQRAREQVETALAELAYFRGIDHARDDRVGTAVLERASPHFGVPLMALAIMISTFGCVNGIILMGARLYYAMAQDRLFFKPVGVLNQRGVPASGLILQGLWSIVLIFSGSYSELLDYIIFAALLFYVLTISGLFILRRKHPEWPRPYRAIGYPLVPAAYLVMCAVIMLSLLVVRPIFSWPSFVIILAGIPVYGLWRWAGRQRVAG